MSIDVSETVEIRRPIDEVASYVVDPGNEPQWINGIRESTAITAGPTGVGSRARRVAGFMGRRIEYTPEVTEYAHAAHLQMRTDVPFPMTIDYDFTRDAGGQEPGSTRFTQRLRGGPTGIAGLMSPLMAMMVRRNIRSDMRRLKAQLESP